MGDVELTKRQYLRHNANASTLMTTAAVKINAATANENKTTALNSTATTITAIIITTGAFTTATKA